MKVNTEQLLWKDLGFSIEMTADGSPSLRAIFGTGESMHHSGGALEETELIYGKLITQKINELKETDLSIEFLVVGLGLAYIEMIIVREALKSKINMDRIRIHSFESLTDLKELFLSWIHSEKLSPEIQNTYDFIESSLNSEWHEIKKTLMLMFSNQQFILHPALDEKSYQGIQVDCILFDAFSAKTSPQLWTEEFLVGFLSNVGKSKCLMSTYASRTTLKNALSKANYSFEIMEGFKGKRNSTRARKND